MKNKVTTIIIILATILLSGAAIYTAIKLYQLRAKPVAPNVPESKPAAHGLQTATPKATATASPNTLICRLKFNIATPTPSPSPTPNPLCNSACTTSTQCPSGLTCSAGFCRNPSCSTITSCLCPTPSPSPTPRPTATPTPSPTPTPVPQCNNSCTNSSQCPSGLSCYIASGTTGFCRNTSCVNETDCSCPVPTNTPSPTPTNSPTHTPTPTNPPTTIAYVPTATPAPQPTLPESGTDWPTILGMGFGVLIIVGSVLLAF